MKKLLLVKTLSFVSIALVSACSDRNTSDSTNTDGIDSDSISTKHAKLNDTAIIIPSIIITIAIPYFIIPYLTNPTDKTSTSGNASWYGDRFNGRLTASGEVFNMNKMTAAHRKLTFGSKVKVTNQGNDKFVVVCVNDRGPYSKNRIIDLSKSAAAKIDMISAGTAKVTLEVQSEPKSWKYGKKVCK